MDLLNKEILNTVKNIYEKNADGEFSKSKLEKQKSLENLSNRLFEFIEPTCWRTEANLAKALDVSERQIKYAKAYLCLNNLITIKPVPNGNRSNPKHYLIKHNQKNMNLIAEKQTSTVKWDILNDVSLKNLQRMPIEEQLDLYQEMNLHFVPFHFPKFKKGSVYCSCRWGRNCDSIGKHPAVYVKELDFSKKSTYQEMKDKWAEKDNRYNVGLLTDNFAVIDVDVKKGGAYSLEYLEENYGAVSRNLVSDSGYGFHIYTSSITKSPINLFGCPGLDIRSQKAFIVAPFSKHYSGKDYTWQSLSVPEPLPDELLEDIKLAVSQRSGTNKSKTLKSNLPKEWTKLPQNITEDYIIPDGLRGDELYQIACRERGKGKNYYEILEVLENINRLNCKPPVIKSRLESTAKSAMSHPTNAERVLDLKP